MADEPKPPYVRFEVRPIEDRAASVEAGHYVGKDVIFALITPAGTRECIEKEVNDWLANLEEGVRQDRIPQTWLTHYKAMYQAYKDGREAPESGTAITNWPAVSPAQVAMLLDIGINTVELLADANDETCQRIGMGGRALKQKAIAYLEAANDAGKLAEKMSALEVENAELKARDKERESELADLKKAVAALQAKETA